MDHTAAASAGHHESHSRLFYRRRYRDTRNKRPYFLSLQEYGAFRLHREFRVLRDDEEHVLEDNVVCGADDRVMARRHIDHLPKEEQKLGEAGERERTNHRYMRSALSSTLDTRESANILKDVRF